MNAPGGDVLVDARGLVRQFGSRRAVDNLSLSIRRGRVLGLLGPNGSGKSTTVRLLTGVLSASAGSIELFGEPLTRQNAPRLRRRIGVQTESKLYTRLTVAENLKYWGALFDLTPTQTRRRTDEVLEVVGLTDRRNDKYGSLSKGLRQKAGIARSLLHEPELLFLDEPTAGLDPEATADLIDHLGELVGSGRTTLVLATHQLQGLDALCDDLVVIRSGELVAAGSVEQLVAEHWPRSRHTLTVSSDISQAIGALCAAGAQVQESTEAQVVFEVDSPDILPGVIDVLVAAGVRVHSLVPSARSVEELYFRLVGRGSDEA